MQTTKHIVLLSAFCLILFYSTSALAQTAPYTVKTVVIDAGHGGKDPGACGKISKEKDLTLSMALKAGSLIAGGCPDVKVIYTRKTDEFIELHKRAEIANKAKADLFISIHVNANPNPDATGTDSWTMGLAKNEANLTVAKMENDVISLESDASQYQGMSANDSMGIAKLWKQRQKRSSSAVFCTLENGNAKCSYRNWFYLKCRRRKMVE